MGCYLRAEGIQEPVGVAVVEHTVGNAGWTLEERFGIRILEGKELVSRRCIDYEDRRT